METSPTTIPTDDEMPALVLEAPRRRLLGFPYVVSITYDNRSRSEYYAVPDLGLDSDSGPIAFSMLPVGTRSGAESFEGRFPTPEEDGRGVSLRPGEKRTMVLDLTNVGASPKAGAYTLVVRHRSKRTRESNRVLVDVVAPSPGDAREAARLRKLRGSVDTGSWQDFDVLAPWPLLPPPSFGGEAARAAALHLFLHDAYHRKWNIDVTRLDTISEPSHAAEVAALKYKVLVARSDPRARATRNALLLRFPGLKHRLDRIDEERSTPSAGVRSGPSDDPGTCRTF